MRLLKDLQPEIKCVHFNGQQINSSDKIKEFETFFRETSHALKISFYSLPGKNRIHDMNNFVDEQNVDVLVMYKPQRGFFESLFHKSFTKDMSMHIKIPLLVQKEESL
ncbi:MAG: hypothetical protein IPL46_04840 [Saprospiraceae bacterium]|nr:hypothetical protein [Saprospiraceae bacterium]